jgi:hypothetical protein
VSTDGWRGPFSDNEEECRKCGNQLAHLKADRIEDPGGLQSIKPAFLGDAEVEEHSGIEVTMKRLQSPGMTVKMYRLPKEYVRIRPG